MPKQFTQAVVGPVLGTNTVDDELGRTGSGEPVTDPFASDFKTNVINPEDDDDEEDTDMLNEFASGSVEDITDDDLEKQANEDFELGDDPNKMEVGQFLSNPSEYIFLRNRGMAVARDVNSSIRMFEARDLKLTMQAGFVLPDSGMVMDINELGATINFTLTAQVVSLIRGIAEDDENGNALTLMPVSEWEFTSDAFISEPLFDNNFVCDVLGNKLDDTIKMVERYVKCCQRNATLATDSLVQRVTDAAELIRGTVVDDEEIDVDTGNVLSTMPEREAVAQATRVRNLARRVGKRRTLTGDRLPELLAAVTEQETSVGIVELRPFVDQALTNLFDHIDSIVNP